MVKANAAQGGHGAFRRHHSGSISFNAPSNLRTRWGPQSKLSNCTWQNGTLGAAQAVASGNYGAITDLGLQLGLDGYPEVLPPARHPARTALQYIENHDHNVRLQFRLEIKARA